MRLYHRVNLSQSERRVSAFPGNQGTPFDILHFVTHSPETSQHFQPHTLHKSLIARLLITISSLNPQKSYLWYLRVPGLSLGKSLLKISPITADVALSSLCIIHKTLHSCMMGVLLKSRKRAKEIKRAAKSV